ncbi:NAD-dependent epimerase/dehydratase family protein [Nocardia sp. NPDC024068]|uniref:NAD-dependent epimerase/dehydratase family protein n=1 Tax=Nocardia sp. NPDC024068 TaxID=3157197 RepID=UPI0033E006C1
MRVFVTGGTGALGVHTVPALVGVGHSVTALARSDEKAAELVAAGATPARISLFDRDALTSALDGYDAVVNLATAIPPMSKFASRRAMRANEYVRTEGSAAVVDAALAAGVGRVVQESVVMFYTDQGAEWITESSPVDRFPLARSNFAAEANAARFGDGGGAAVVLRFGVFYGPGARHSEQMLALARRGIGMTLGRPDSYMSSIHVADAGRAVAAALEVAPGTYNVVDDEPLTTRDYSDALARAAGRGLWIRGPGRAAGLLGDRLTSLTRSLRVSNTRFRDATEWVPRHPSAREGWLATAEILPG